LSKDTTSVNILTEENLLVLYIKSRARIGMICNKKPAVL